LIYRYRAVAINYHPQLTFLRPSLMNKIAFACARAAGGISDDFQYIQPIDECIAKRFSHAVLFAL
jgi:hypothetical protein